MANYNPLILLRLFLLSTAILLLQSNLCFSIKHNSLILPLKAQAISSGASFPKKLSFHHNVSLTVSLTVGTPPQPVTMVLDTGSELSWLNCNKTPLTGLTHHSFDPTRSSSYTPLPCFSPTCRTRTRDFTIPVSCDTKKLCHAVLSYADASSAEGNLAGDTFRYGEGETVLPGMIFGCMDSGYSSNPDEDSRTTGLIGMNRGSLSFVSQMGFSKFSYCISGSDSSGVLVFGEEGINLPLNYTPLVKISTPLPYFDRVAYTVELEGIKVSGKILSLPKSILVPDHTGAGQTMVDSGTQFSFLLGPVYTALKKEFSGQVGGLLRPLGEVDFVFEGAMDLCYRVEIGRSVLPGLPGVTLMFRGAEMVVAGERLMYRVPGMVRGKDWVYCFTFGNSDLLGIEAYVIGHHHQQNVWMEFDIGNSRVGLAEVRCDLASQRLGL